MQGPDAQAAAAAAGKQPIWHKTESKYVRRKADGTYAFHIQTRKGHIMGADHNTLEEALAEFRLRQQQAYAARHNMSQHSNKAHQRSTGQKRQLHTAAPGNQLKDVVDMQEGLNKVYSPLPVQEAPSSKRHCMYAPTAPPTTAQMAARSTDGLCRLSLRPPADRRQQHRSQYTPTTPAGSAAAYWPSAGTLAGRGAADSLAAIAPQAAAAAAAGGGPALMARAAGTALAAASASAGGSYAVPQSRQARLASSGVTRTMTAAGAGVGVLQSTHYMQTAGTQGTAAGRSSIAQGEAATGAEDALAADPLELPPTQTPAAGTGQEQLQDKSAMHPAAAAAAGDAESVDGCIVQICERFGEEMTTVGYDGVRLLEPIGLGAYGVVYKGQLIKQKQSNSAAVAGFQNEQSDAHGGGGSSCKGPFVAVKVFPPCMRPPMADGCTCGACYSFNSECNALALLQHRPGVVRLLANGVIMRDGIQAAAATAPAAGEFSDVVAATEGHSTGGSGTQQQIPYRLCVVMELADGTLEGTEKCSEQEASALMLPLVTTLAVLHSGNLGDEKDTRVVHRDIKPSNILLTRRGPVFCDFSCCAICLGSDRPQKMYTRAGTDLHMAPEVDTASHKGYSCDVDSYSMGVLAASLLMGGSFALLERAENHATCTLKGWLNDFCRGREIPHEQGVSNQARDFVRCCCMLRQQPVELLLHEWLQEAQDAAYKSQLESGDS